MIITHRGKMVSVLKNELIECEVKVNFAFDSLVTFYIQALRLQLLKTQVPEKVRVDQGLEVAAQAEQRVRASKTKK
jgi:hypothetical protein